MLRQAKIAEENEANRVHVRKRRDDANNAKVAEYNRIDEENTSRN